MSGERKNKKSFDYKLIAIYIIVIALGFFSAKAVFVLSSKCSSAKKPHTINTASFVIKIPDKVAVESVVKPIVKPIFKPVIAAEVNIPLESENEKKISSASEAAVPVIYASAEESAKFVLNGIAFSEEPGQISFALINNKVVKTGEKVALAEVMKITKNSVELKTKDSKIVILFQKK